jgi:pSer/pThr/pTyr-binding forkhead associated (FHA) protein
VNSPLAIQLMRFGFLFLLWLFVYGTVRVIRADLRATSRPRVGAPPTRRSARRRQSVAPPTTGPRGATQLVVTEGGLAGTRIALTGAPILIGRANDSTLVLTDDYASTRHARISHQGESWFVEDLGSTNGTWVGPNKLAGPMILEIGVPVRIGATAMELR